MTTAQRQVREFMIKAGQECPALPRIPSMEICLLRLGLIDEENKELALAMSRNDPVEAYDAILDLLYVVIGTAVACGMEIEPGWQEVHRSNMTKFTDGFRNESGKFIKGPSYSPADLQPILEQQTKNK